MTQTARPTAVPTGPEARPADPAPPPSLSLSRRRAPRTRRTGTGTLLRGAIPILAFLLVWELLPLLLTPTARVFLPQFHVVAAAWWELALSGVLWQDFRASLIRSLLGFGIATAAGVLLGLMVGWFRPLAEALLPLLEIFRSTAALALLPVFTLLLGIGELSKIAIVVFASFFPVLLNTIAGVRTVDPTLIRAGRSLGLSQPRMFRQIVLPAAVPTIFTGIRMAGAASILVLIAAEMVGANAGLGFLITSTQNSFLIPEMYAGIITIALLGLLINIALVRTEQRFSRWRAPAR